MKIRDFARTYLTSFCVFFIIGIFLVITSSFLLSEYYGQNAFYETANATVISIDENDDKYVITLEYNINATIYTSQITSKSNWAVINESVLINYNRNDYADISINTDYVYSYYVLLGLSVGLIAIGVVFAVRYYYFIFKKIHLRKHGVMKEATITSVEKMKNATKNERFPYYFNCKIAGNDNIYSSTNFNLKEENLNILIGKQVNIYIDDNNQKDYFVDLRSVNI